MLLLFAVCVCVFAHDFSACSCGGYRRRCRCCCWIHLYFVKLWNHFSTEFQNKNLVEKKTTKKWIKANENNNKWNQTTDERLITTIRTHMVWLCAVRTALLIESAYASVWRVCVLIRARQCIRISSTHFIWIVVINWWRKDTRWKKKKKMCQCFNWFYSIASFRWKWRFFIFVSRCVSLLLYQFFYLLVVAISHPIVVNCCLSFAENKRKKTNKWSIQSTINLPCWDNVIILCIQYSVHSTIFTICSFAHIRSFLCLCLCFYWKKNGRTIVFVLQELMRYCPKKNWRWWHDGVVSLGIRQIVFICIRCILCVRTSCDDAKQLIEFPVTIEECRFICIRN